LAPRSRYILYPTRCIRRKNIGEALFWSVLAGDDVSFGMTLPPLTPVELPAYQRWKSLAAALRLSCYFEVGQLPGVSFQENLAAADLILTTSVAEGFGLVFLESWLAGRYLIGRDLPEVTTDFLESGVRLPSLEPELLVPLDWLGKDEFEDSIYRTYRQALTDYGWAAPAKQIFIKELGDLVRDGLVDFGLLATPLQTLVIQRARQNTTCRQRLLRDNPWLAETLSLHSDQMQPTIQHNAESIRRCYSLKACGEKLLDIYRKLSASPRSERLSGPAEGAKILDYFLQLRRFRPLRTTQ
jgi:hypothetical protein